MDKLKTLTASMQVTLKQQAKTVELRKETTADQAHLKALHAKAQALGIRVPVPGVAAAGRATGRGRAYATAASTESAILKVARLSQLVLDSQTESCIRNHFSVLFFLFSFCVTTLLITPSALQISDLLPFVLLLCLRRVLNQSPT